MADNIISHGRHNGRADVMNSVDVSGEILLF